MFGSVDTVAFFGGVGVSGSSFGIWSHQCLGGVGGMMVGWLVGPGGAHLRIFGCCCRRRV